MAQLRRERRARGVTGQLYARRAAGRRSPPASQNRQHSSAAAVPETRQTHRAPTEEGRRPPGVHTDILQVSRPNERDFRRRLKERSGRLGWRDAHVSGRFVQPRRSAKVTEVSAGLGVGCRSESHDWPLCLRRGGDPWRMLPPDDRPVRLQLIVLHGSTNPRGVYELTRTLGLRKIAPFRTKCPIQVARYIAP